MPRTRYEKNTVLDICHVDHLRLDLGPEPQLEESLPPDAASARKSPAAFVPVDVPVPDPALEAVEDAPTPKSRKRGESQED